jgi:hypothetical protein
MPEAKRIAIIEPIPVEVELITNILCIEPMGSLACVVLYQEQTLYDGEPTTVRVVKRRLAVTHEDMATAVQMVLAYLGCRVLTTAQSLLHKAIRPHH